MNIALLDGIAAISDRYTAVICDLWGVVHNGREPYPDALDCLRRLRALGAPVILLSNAPREAEVVERQLRNLGVGRDVYDHIVTSGDLVRRALSAPLADIGLGGRRALYLGPERDLALLDGTDLDVVGGTEAVSRTDFVVCTGPVDDETETAEDYRPFLVEARGRGLPFLCANPDLTVMRGDHIVPCAGALAALYESLGGHVLWFGKPHPRAYDACLALLSDDRTARILALGDSLRTDIAGARAMGFDSVLVADGIHADELAAVLKDGGGRHIDARRLAALCRAEGAKPTAAMLRLRW